ncbi:hypothetical protein [Cronobacter sakazakii]|uniref:hypothetical protein n=1 Tax=Cronobacter sakazakii TaxID=28141 RepID=UPI000AE31E15|nr:hypothetical protein [Cronobacter sakazakii]EKK4013100.1 hypothetical protein [Cronobacter sakazakii]
MPQQLPSPFVTNSKRVKIIETAVVAHHIFNPLSLNGHDVKNAGCPGKGTCIIKVLNDLYIN